MLPGRVGDISAACKGSVDTFDFHLAFFRNEAVIDKIGSCTGIIVSCDLFAQCTGQIIVENEIHGRDGQARCVGRAVAESAAAVFFINGGQELAEGVSFFCALEIAVLIESTECPPGVDKAAFLFVRPQD